MKPDEQDSRIAAGREFLTTRWSVVLAAGAEGASVAAEAMQQLCRVYWYPLYAFVRRCGNSPDDAQDLTQEFFALLLKRSDLAGVRREKGRFRSFLLASAKHFLSNERKKARRLKRGGGRHIISIDSCSAEHRYACEPSHDLTPEQLFERRWVMTLLDNTLDQLRGEFIKAGKAAVFERLSVFLTGDENGPRYGDVGADLGLTEASVKMAVSRLRRRYRQILRTQIGQTVAGEEDIKAEIQHLFTVLARD
jgi:RNA polymerase sigma factor (sigma-70 family)